MTWKVLISLELALTKFDSGVSSIILVLTKLYWVDLTSYKCLGLNDELIALTKLTKVRHWLSWEVFMTML